MPYSTLRYETADTGVATIRGKGKKERLAFFGATSLNAIRAWLRGRASN